MADSITRHFAGLADAAGFEDMRHARHETVEKDHGRIETRRLDSTRDIDWFQDREQQGNRILTVP